MGLITRRRVLQCSGAGIAAILAEHRAPVFAQASTVHILRGTSFIPAADKVWRENYPLEAQKALGIKLNFEAINTNDIPARATAAIQSGNGPDILGLTNNYPHLYAAAAVDVSSVANEVNKSGGIPEALVQLNKVDGKWVAVPHAVAPTLIAHAYHTAASHMVMKYSKNTKAALELLRWLHQRENYEKWFVVHKGYVVGPTRDWEDHPMWKEDPAMASFRTAPQAQTRQMGFARQPDKHAAEAWNKYIVTVMYAQACSGKLSPEESVKWAAGELGKVYS